MLGGDRCKNDERRRLRAKNMRDYGAADLAHPAQGYLCCLLPEPIECTALSSAAKPMTPPATVRPSRPSGPTGPAPPSVAARL